MNIVRTNTITVTAPVVIRGTNLVTWLRVTQDAIELFQVKSLNHSLLVKQVTAILIEDPLAFAGEYTLKVNKR
jgi:hypothetical protein